MSGTPCKPYPDSAFITIKKYQTVKRTNTFIFLVHLTSETECCRFKASDGNPLPLLYLFVSL